MLGREISWINPASIIIPEKRQRKEAIDTSDLLPSIRERGILNPLIITKGLELIAGERRLRTALELNLAEIPCRFDGDLSPLERRIVELEENERRKDLHWRDQVLAIAELHGLYAKKAEEDGEKWSVTKTADLLFYSHQHLYLVLRVYKDLENPRIKDAPGLKAAFNILDRIDERKIGDAMSTIAQAGASVVQKPTASIGGSATGGSSPTQEGTSGRYESKQEELPKIPPEELSILNVSFIEWLESYEGPRFNLIHCDFPFGVNLFRGEQGGKDKWLGYDDDPNVYWQLLTAFCKHRDKFMAQSAHLVFWFSMDFYSDTIEFFAKHAPDINISPKPLIWHKSDNVGVLADPKRWPRHIYETALIGSRDDRLIIQATSDLYAAPTDKAHHPSTKPEPMLRNFFRMFVDEHTTMLDPTCGSGAALRAAESLGAVQVLGLEIDPEHCENARSALRQFRAKEILRKRLEK